MQPIRVGLAAFGRSGAVFHAPYLRGNPDYEVAAVLERSTERCRGTFPDARIVRTYAALTGVREIDLIVVNTPDELHYPMARAALEAGKHVVVEKPFVASAREAVDLQRHARRRGLVLTVYQNRRFDGDFLALERLLATGAMGDVVEFESRFEVDRPVDPAAWREQPSVFSGVLSNFGPHLIDQAIALFGMPLAVSASVRSIRSGTRVPDSFRIELDYPGHHAALIGSYQARVPRMRFLVNGTDATWVSYGLVQPDERTNRPGGPTQHAVLVRRTASGTQREPMEIAASDYGLFYARLTRAIRSGGRAPVTTSEALGTVRIIEQALQSHARRCALSFPADPRPGNRV